MEVTTADEDLVLSNIPKAGKIRVEKLTAIVSSSPTKKSSGTAKALRALQSQGKIVIFEEKGYGNFPRYAVSIYSGWFWLVAGATLVSLVLTSVGSGPALYLRYLFGSLLFLLLPGYAFVELLFAKNNEQHFFARLAISVGLSIVVTASIALVLNFTFGIALLELGIALASVTIAASLGGIARKYRAYKLLRHATDLG
jgi:Protein of unknown function (DUF1616)